MTIWGIVGLDLSEFGDCLVFSWVNNVLHMFWKVAVIFAVWKLVTTVTHNLSRPWCILSKLTVSIKNQRGIGSFKTNHDRDILPVMAVTPSYPAASPPSQKQKPQTTHPHHLRFLLLFLSTTLPPISPAPELLCRRRPPFFSFSTPSRPPNIRQNSHKLPNIPNQPKTIGIPKTFNFTPTPISSLLRPSKASPESSSTQGSF